MRVRGIEIKPDSGVYFTHTGYLLREVPAPDIPPRVEVGGQIFEAKTEFHVSIFSAEALAQRIQQAAPEPTHFSEPLPPDIEDIVHTAAETLGAFPLQFTGYKDEFFECRRDGDASIVALAGLGRVSAFFREVRARLGIPSQLLPNPLPHVTLYTQGSPYGIAIPDAGALRQYGRPLSQEEAAPIRSSDAFNQRS